MSWISLETILELITVLILAILVIRWVRKYLAKKKERKNRKLLDIIRPSAPVRQTSFISELPRGFISELPANSDLSHTRAITHTKNAPIEDRDDAIGLSALRL